MDESIAKEFYSRPDIQERLLYFAKDREIGVVYDGYFGKRPDIIENYTDLKILINKGVRSFHLSEERWLNPLILGGEKTQEDRDKNRLGWDLILDLDGVCFEYSQIVGKIIIDYLASINVHNVSVKFSGNKGFHIAIPFEAFSKYNGIQETRLLFPQIAKEIALYLMYVLRKPITDEILKQDISIENIAKKYNLDANDLRNNDKESNNFDFMKVIEIDTILITTRHLFRAPYSFNEKSGLVSIPVEKSRIVDFKKDEAKAENVRPKEYECFEFLKYDSKYGRDGDILLSIIEDQSIDDDFGEKGGHYIDSNSIKEAQSGFRSFKSDKAGRLSLASGGEVFEITGQIDIKDFPKTIDFVLNNKLEDGRKRALFLLLTYLYSVNYESDVVEELINKWNDMQDDPLKKNYLQAQLSWFKVQQKKISPPKFANNNYYKQIGIPQEIIDKDKTAFPKITCKTPLQHSFLFLKQKEKQGKKKGKKK